MTKIESVEFVRLYPTSFKESWGKDSIWPGSPPCFIVRITAENGVCGIGEVSSQPWYLGETAEQLAANLQLYAERLEGADPSNITAAHRTMEMALSGGMPGGRSARCGIDMALHDLLGKLWGVPVATLLGGARRSRIDLMTNLYHKTPDAMAKAAASFVAEGFRALKIKVGDVIWRDGVNTRSIVEETSFLEAALSVVPREIMIDADANQAWSNPGLTVARLSKFASFENFSIEQPLHYANIEGHREIRRRSSVPVILDESVWSPEAAQQLVRSGACDRVVLKMNRVGGFQPSHAVIVLCEAAGISVSVDTNPFTLVGDTAICHLGAVTRDHYPICADGHLTFIKLSDPGAITGGVKFIDGCAQLPDAPGIGVDVDWKRLAAMSALGEPA
jgi:L-alanine-DL-glutamate epimerase-like enolase superfamily enzyme